MSLNVEINNYEFVRNPELLSVKDIRYESIFGEQNETLSIYKNGYIPTYNFKEKVYGYIDLIGDIHYVRGDLQILDFIDDYILVKVFSENNKDKICFIDYNYNIISEFYIK